MNRREFFQKGGVIFSGLLLPQFAPSKEVEKFNIITDVLEARFDVNKNIIVTFSSEFEAINKNKLYYTSGCRQIIRRNQIVCYLNDKPLYGCQAFNVKEGWADVITQGRLQTRVYGKIQGFVKDTDLISLKPSYLPDWKD